MQVEQLMTRPVYTCHPSDDLCQAARVMWEHDCGCVPVVDGEDKAVGMITDRDLAMAAYTQGKKLSEMRVEEVMSRKVHSCGPLDPIRTAEERMQKYQVRRLPVLEPDGTLVGIVALNDIVLEAARERGTRKPQVSADEVAVTLAAVSEHRAESIAKAT